MFVSHISLHKQQGLRYSLLVMIFDTIYNYLSQLPIATIVGNFQQDRSIFSNIVKTLMLHGGLILFECIRNELVVKFGSKNDCNSRSLVMYITNCMFVLV